MPTTAATGGWIDSGSDSAWRHYTNIWYLINETYACCESFAML